MREFHTYIANPGPKKLEIGACANLRPGWLSTDKDARPGVMAMDATQAFPMGSEIFDFIYSEHMIEHISFNDGQQMLRECWRVLKPGGRLVCLEFSTPVWPWFRGLYNFYSRYIIPCAGLLIAGSREAYEYLPDSIKKFPLPAALADEMLRAGFNNVGYARLTNGIAAIHCGEKA